MGNIVYTLFGSRFFSQEFYTIISKIIGWTLHGAQGPNYVYTDNNPVKKIKIKAVVVC